MPEEKPTIRALESAASFGRGHLISIREDMPTDPKDARQASWSPKAVRDLDLAITALTATPMLVKALRRARPHIDALSRTDDDPNLKRDLAYIESVLASLRDVEH